MAMAHFAKKMVWLAQLVAALSCGLLVFLGLQMAGNNSGTGQGIYIFLCDVFGVPQTVKKTDSLLAIAGIALGILAMIPGILVATNLYAFLNSRGSRFNLQSALVATTGVCLFLAMVCMFRSSEATWSGLPNAWLFMAIYSTLTWYLVHSFRSMRRVVPAPNEPVPLE